MYQLNAAAKGIVMQHPRCYLLDVETLVAEFVCPQEYLRDHARYNPAVIFAILNFYLNRSEHAAKLLAAQRAASLASTLNADPHQPCKTHLSHCVMKVTRVGALVVQMFLGMSTFH